MQGHSYSSYAMKLGSQGRVARRDWLSENTGLNHWVCYKGLVGTLLEMKPTCSKPSCKQDKILKLHKGSGKKYCSNHHPSRRKKAKKDSSEGGKKSAEVRAEARRIDSIVSQFEITGDKTSAIKQLISLFNFTGQIVHLHDLKTLKQLGDWAAKIHELCDKDSGEMEEEESIKAIMDSDLPDFIKLSKVADLVGPKKAVEMVTLEQEADEYTAHVLDGVEMMKEEGEDGEATIGIPDTLKFRSLDEEGEEEEGEGEPEEAGKKKEIPALDLPAKEDSIPSQGDASASPPEHTIPPTAEISASAGTPEEREARIQRQSDELLKLYRKKVGGSFKLPAAVRVVFESALHEDVPFDPLKMRCQNPKSNTDQPEMMVRDVRKAVEKAQN